MQWKRSIEDKYTSISQQNKTQLLELTTTFWTLPKYYHNCIITYKEAIFLSTGGIFCIIIETILQGWMSVAIK